MTTFASNFNGCLPFSDMAVSFGLTANTELTYTIPGDNTKTYRCEFAWPYNANVHVGYNVTATTPSLNAVAQTPNIELRPSVRYVRGGDVLHFKSIADVTDAGFSLLQLPG